MTYYVLTSKNKYGLDVVFSFSDTPITNYNYTFDTWPSDTWDEPYGSDWVQEESWISHLCTIR